MTIIRPTTSTTTPIPRPSTALRSRAACYYVVVPAVIFAVASYLCVGGARQELVTEKKVGVGREGGKDTSSSTTMDGTSISYISVAADKSDNSGGDVPVLRYAAVNTSTPGSPQRPITTREFMELLSQDTPSSRLVAKELTNIIRECPYRGLFFETKGVDSESVSTTPFEFVLVDAPQLARFAEHSPDQDAFAEHLNCDGGSGTTTTTCCAFDNLGGDARLIAPRMTSSDASDPKVYSHLAAYIRGASDEEIHQLWIMAASEYLQKVKERGEGRKTWFSTSGMGIAWLHFRIDSFPKYYQYRPFKNV